MRVAVDAMGGDHAPREVVAGCLEAARDDPGLEIVLVGRREIVEAEIAGLGGSGARVSVVDARDTVPMDERPVEALKRRPEASVLKAVQLAARGEAAVVVSAGSTADTVAASLMALKRLPG
ncbi:MAG: phosphate acyltransferase PlsX, partial [Planctomycetota bacterium]